MKVFNSNEFNTINESFSENKSIVEAFLKVGPIRMADGSIHNPNEFVDIVNLALTMFEKNYKWEYNFIKYARVIYLLDGRITKTMCVDDRGDLYINVEFIYSFLKMNPKYIMYILYHEAMHNILSHVQRGIEYGKTHDKLTWREMNICADFEVNGQMVADHICSPTDWDILHGCYDPQFKGMTFEMIANVKRKINNVNTELEWNPTIGDNSGKSPSVKKVKNQKLYNKGKQQMSNAINKLLNKNKGDKKTTINQLGELFKKTKDPSIMLSEIEKLTNMAVTNYIMDSKLFESVTQDEDWIAGLKDGFSDSLNQLINSTDSDNTSEDISRISDIADELIKKLGELEDTENTVEQEDESEEDSSDALKELVQDLKDMINDAKDNLDEEDEDTHDLESKLDDLSNKLKDIENSLNNNDTDDLKDKIEDLKEQIRDIENDIFEPTSLFDDGIGEGGQSDDGEETPSDSDNALNSEDLPTDMIMDFPQNDDSTKELRTNIKDGNSMVGRIVKHSEIESELQKSLEASGYDADDILAIYDDILMRPKPSTGEMKSLRDEIISNKKNSTLADLCNKVNVEENVADEVWEELVKKFLERNTTRRGSDNTVEDPKDIRWGNKRYLSMDDIIMPYHGKTSAAPQYINIFIDCSGSINTEVCVYFMNMIEKLCAKLEFSGLRLIPFSDAVEESKIVGCTTEELKEPKTIDMLKQFIYDCKVNYYGGGGNSYSFKCIADHITKCDLAEPESVYLVMTDGGLFDTRNIMRFKPYSERVLFCIADNGIKETLKNLTSYLGWCVIPKYAFLEKVYIELNEVKM